MKLEARIAWRSIWRQPRRSAVLMGAVAVAVFTWVGSTAFTDGFGAQMVQSAVNLQGGHIQVNAPGYFTNPSLRVRMDTSIVNRIRTVTGQQAGTHVAGQLSNTGMANAPAQSAAITVTGVVPAEESLVTTIASNVEEGRYLTDDDDGVLIGAELADDLGLRLGEKLVIMVNNDETEVSAAAYRIVGLYRSGNAPFDRMHVFISMGAARALLGVPNGLTTVTIVLGDDAQTVNTAENLRNALPEAEVLTWRERNPMLEMMEEAYDYSALLTAIILFIAVGFILVNSFLMVIFERIKEFGVMLAAGTKPAVIRRMLVLEALMTSLMGLAGGLALSAVLLGFWFRNGLDLSRFASGLSEFGMDSVVYPVLDASHLLPGIALILVMVVLAVQYPAWRASRFKPVEAMQHD